jgi:hypothetical protein
MTVRFVIVAEDELGQKLTRDLADRVVAERARAEWLRDLWDEDGRDSQRAYQGFQPEAGWSNWGDVKRLANELSIRAHGIGMKAERAMAHKAVAIMAELETRSPGATPIDALFLDPVTHPERLTANRVTDKHDAKRACVALAGPPGDTYEAWEPCWRDTPLEMLDRNGARAGLADYTREVADKILPLLSDAPSRADATPRG